MPTSWKVNNEGSFASLTVQLSNASLETESDAVVTMSEGIEVGGHLSGGFFNSLVKSVLSRKSFFTTRVETDLNKTGDVLIAPTGPGGICLHRMEGPQDAMMLTSSSYLACDESVDITTVMQRGVQNSLLSGTGFFLMQATGRGVLAMSAYGPIHKYVLAPGEHRMVDNGHLVAWSANMAYRTEMASKSLWNTVISGAGLMCKFSGPGVIYLQSHKIDSAEDGSRNKKQSSLVGNGGIIVVVLFAMMFSFVGGMIAFVKVQEYMENSSHGGNNINSDSYNGYSGRRVGNEF